MQPDLERRLGPLRTYLVIRKGHWVLGLAVLTGVLLAYFGNTEVATPAAASDGAPVAIWRLSSIVAGSLPVLTLVSPLQAVEAASGWRFCRCRLTVLLGSLLLCSVTLLLGAALGAGTSVIGPMTRAVLAWFGLALLAGRLIGWRFGWLGPWVALTALLYWGYNGERQVFRWWEFTAHPLEHMPSLFLSAGLCLAGSVAYAASPWRRWRLATHAVRRGEPVQRPPDGEGPGTDGVPFPPVLSGSSELGL